MLLTFLWIPDGAHGQREPTRRASGPVVLSGTVTGAESGELLPGVNVFLSGTTHGGATDSTGRYEIRGVSPGTYTLVASMVGYETASAEITVEYGQPPMRRDFALRQASYTLSEVRVEADRPEHWDERFERFRRQFIGASDWADQVHIVNRYALSFDVKTAGEGGKRLTASAEEPLVIENRALGYRITFALRGFAFSETGEETGQVRYDGYFYFREMDAESEEQWTQWTARRQEALLGSRQHFLWALTHDRLSAEGFELRRGHPPIDDEAQPYVTERVAAGDVLTPTGSPGIYRIGFEGFLRLTYEEPGSGGFFTPAHRQVTWLTMHRPAGRVHQEGWFLPPSPVTFRGAMGRRRMAERLPNAYVDAQRRGVAADQPSPAAGGEATPASTTPDASALDRSAYELAFGPWRADAPALEEAARAMREGRWKEAHDRLSDVLEEYPDDLTARYLRGVTARHLALRTRIRDIDYWNRGIRDLKYVLARDSTFRDALAQYARFSALTFPRSDLRWHENITTREAIRLTRRQLALKPDLPQARLALIRLYEQLLHEESPEEALEWLLRPGARGLDRYFAAEALRRDGRDAEAERMLLWLIERRSPEVPRSLLYLGRVRLAAGRGRPSAADDYMQAAIDAIATPLDAALLFDVVKYIVRPNELKTYRALHTPEAYRRFFETLWARRHPALGAPVNPRIAVHFRRLDVARERFLYGGPIGAKRGVVPEWIGAFDLPSTYRFNDVFNDKGLVYIRHGPPDDQISTSDAIVPPNESWRYDDPRMDFHFFRIIAHNNWRLAPGLEYQDEFGRFLEDLPSEGPARTNHRFGRDVSPVVEDRADWGSAYVHLWRGDPGAQIEFVEAARAWVEQGLRTDRHTWPDHQQAFSAPYMASAFRGASGSTRVVVDYVLPIGQVTQALADAQDSTGLEAGVALYDTTWRAADRKLRQGLLPTSAGPTTAAIDRFRLTVAPGTYQLGLYAKAQATGQMAAYQAEYVVPDFTGHALMLSDLVPAYSVRPAGADEASDRNGMAISANPTGAFRADRPISVYFEIYNLTYGEGDNTQYTVKYALVPLEGDESLLARIVGQDDERVALSVENTAEGEERAPAEYIVLDVSDVAPGRYGIVVEVTDQHTGQAVRQTRSIELTREEM